MDRIDVFQALGKTDRTDPSDVTVINGAPFNGLTPVQIGAETRLDPSDGHVSEEIKQRQIAIATRYIAAVRSCAR